MPTSAADRMSRSFVETNNWAIIKVKFFKNPTREGGSYMRGEGFGFASTDDDESFFFHIANQHHFDCGDDENWMTPVVSKRPSFGKEKTISCEEKIILIEVGPSRKEGEKESALKWARMLSLEDAFAKCKQAKVYRIVRHHIKAKGSKEEEWKSLDVLWEGNNQQVMAAFISGNRRELHDTKDPQRSLVFKEHHFLERKTQDGWEEVERYARLGALPGITLYNKENGFGFLHR